MIVISILQMRKPRLRKLEDSGHYNDHDYTATVCVWLMKRPWFWERLRGGEGDNRGWDGWMASPTQWTRVWVNTGSWWWTGRPGVLQSVGSQRVAHDWATELNWTEWNENSEPLKHPKRTLQEWFMSKATHGLSFPSNPQICPLSPPPENSLACWSLCLWFFPHDLGSPDTWSNFLSKPCFLHCLPFSKCAVLFRSCIHSVSIYWKPIMRQMVALRTEWLARQMFSLTSCCPQSGLFQTDCILFPLFMILSLPTTPQPAPQQGKILLIHKIQPTLFLLCHLPQQPGDDIQSTEQPAGQS